METKTESQLIDLFSNVNIGTFVYIVTETVPKMNKTYKNEFGERLPNPYFGRVIKIRKMNYLMGNSYETRVQNNEFKEGFEKDFKSQSLKGKHHISKCILESDRDPSVKYVQLEVNQNKLSEIELYYILDGEPLYTKSTPEHYVSEKVLKNNITVTVMIENYITKPSENKSQIQEKKVISKNPKISSIREVSIFGNHYIIE